MFYTYGSFEFVSMVCAVGRRVALTDARYIHGELYAETG